MKKSRVNYRFPSPADVNPHSASRTACPASHRDHLSLFAGNDDEFNSHPEDNQDLAPDTLRHSGLWSFGMGHTGNPSDNEHSAHRLQSVRPDSVVRWSILFNRKYSLRTSVRIRARVTFFRTRHRPDVSSSSRRDNSTHRAAILLRHADQGELFSGFVAQASLCQEPFSLLRLGLSEMS